MAWFLLIPIGWFFIGREIYEMALVAGPYDIPSKWPWGLFEWLFATFNFVLGTAIAGMVCAGIASLCGSWFDKWKIWGWHDVSSTPLISVRDKDGLEGGIAGGLFIFSGYVGSSPYYFYYTENEDGSYQPGKVYAGSNVRIFESDGADPKLVKRKMKTRWLWVHWFGFCSESWRYDFHAPTGTVRREMSV